MNGLRSRRAVLGSKPGTVPTGDRRILAVMTTRSRAERPHLATSPFKPRSEPLVDLFVLDDRVSHDTYGLGRVVGVDAGAVTVDFGGRKVRIASPYRKLKKL